MASSRSLLCLLALALLALTVHSDQELTDLFNSPIVHAERVQRPLSWLPVSLGWLSHSGVRVTLENDDQYLIHKGPDYSRMSDTVVTAASDMSPRWKSVKSYDVDGSTTVGELVAAGGTDYSLGTKNCHVATRNMEKVIKANMED